MQTEVSRVVSLMRKGLQIIVIPSVSTGNLVLVTPQTPNLWMLKSLIENGVLFE
jgi:hypothetical protein